MAYITLNEDLVSGTVKLYGRSAIETLDIYTLRLNTDCCAYKQLMAEEIPSKELIYYSISGFSHAYRHPVSKFIKEDRPKRPDKDWFLFGEGNLTNDTGELRFGSAFEMFPDSEKEPTFPGDPEVERDKRKYSDFANDQNGDDFVLIRNDGERSFWRVLTDYNINCSRVMQITKAQFMVDQALKGRFDIIKLANPTEDEYRLLVTSFDMVGTMEKIDLKQFEQQELQLMTDEEKQRITDNNGVIHTTARQLGEIGKKQEFFAEKVKALKIVA